MNLSTSANNQNHNRFKPFLYAREEGNKKINLQDKSTGLRKLKGDNPFQEKHLSSLSQLIEDIKPSENGRCAGVVFRGHADSNWSIRSSFARFLEDENNITPENPCLLNYSKWQTATMIFNNELDFPETQEGISPEQKLAFMQHYNYPSPLVDWTDNLYHAIFFALDGPPPHDPSHFTIYAIDVGKMHATSFTESQYEWQCLKEMHLSENQVPHWALIRPGDFWDFRMSIQEAVFSFQQHLETMEKYVSKTSSHPNTLVKFNLPISLRQKALKLLEAKGVTKERI